MNKTEHIPLNTIKISQKAINKVKEFAKRDSREKFGLKVAVQGGGCSGLQYMLEIVDGPDKDDKIIIEDGLQIYVPKKAYVFLAGTLLDYSDGLNGKGFEFMNPIEEILKEIPTPSFSVDKSTIMYRIEGKQSIDFLDRISTNKISDKTKNISSKTIITDNKGSIVDILSYSIINESQINFVIKKNNVKKTLNHIRDFIILEDIDIILDQPIIRLSTFNIDDFKIPKLQKQSLLSFKYENDLINSREFFIYENNFEKLSINVLKDNKIQNISNQEANLIDLYSKKIKFDNRVSKVNPLECGLYEYISFDKGCYIGQEVIARLHNYEKISRKLTYFISENPVKKNENIKINNISVGKILDFEYYKEIFFGISLIKTRASDNFVNNGLIYLS